VVDRVGDTVSGVAQGGVAAVQDLVDRIRGLTPRRSRPTGSSTARRSATKVRGTAGGAVDEVVSSVRAARDRGEDVVDEAKGAVDDVAKTARRGARKTRAAAAGTSGSTTSKQKAG
jgi:hypothetical protein